MGVRETSLSAYRRLDLQQSETALMRLVHRHYPVPAMFTRKELSAKTGWEINRIAGRVNSLVAKGYLTEYDQTRDGGHLLSVTPPNLAAPSAPPSGDSPVPAPGTERTEAAGPKTATAGSMNLAEASMDGEASGGQSAAGPDEALVTTWDREGKSFQYVAVGRLA